LKITYGIAGGNVLEIDPYKNKIRMTIRGK
jgi:hypothetical protein